MELVVGLIILLVTLIVAALAVYLIATILELRNINAGLQVVLAGVEEIAQKTAPVNGVLDAINGTLVAGRDLLEGLAVKKAGLDAAGLVESCFPGEGQGFLRRIGRSGAVVAIGEDYPRGAAILNSLLGAGPAPPPPTGNGGGGPSAAIRSGGRITLRSSKPAPPPETPTVPGRISVVGARPWE